MTRFIPRARLAFSSVACAVCLLAIGVHVVCGADLDPQSLLGEWQGTWSLANFRGYNGNQYIMINKVEGEKVYGRSERPASGNAPASNWNFVGTLAGNVMTVKAADFVMELTIDGKNMTGWSLARGNRSDLKLLKK